MKAMLICGSRNPDGQTARAAGAVMKGFLSMPKNSAELAFLPDLKLERCRQCEDSGWGLCRHEGRCVIEDDFAGLVDKIRHADAAVFATPVYYSDLSESMRAFTDRLRRICTHETGNMSIRGKPAVGLCVAGGGGGGAPACCVSLERVLGTCGFDVLDMVPVRRQNLKAKLKSLETIGQWLTEQASAIR
jgi:multimeric flavodoxin WrbA